MRNAKRRAETFGEAVREADRAGEEREAERLPCGDEERAANFDVGRVGFAGGQIDEERSESRERERLVDVSRRGSVEVLDGMVDGADAVLSACMRAQRTQCSATVAPASEA